MTTILTIADVVDTTRWTVEAHRASTLHTIVCALASTEPISWNDTCQCGHVRSRHDNLRHDPVHDHIGDHVVICTGRLNAGACLWSGCTCTRFTIDGLVYLLHFDQPYRGTRHYTGYTSNLANITSSRGGGTGHHTDRYLTGLHTAGISFQLARTWPGTPDTARALKSQGGASRRCPLCGIHPTPTKAITVHKGGTP